ncbi:MAG TPA: lasso peptide biosynthesis B2 protein [Candidatus Acidoferrales bacterium]|nr:lasso peptide biosynthesis B2 protein [Candidatus Acidoferrales bacterium]
MRRALLRFIRLSATERTLFFRSAILLPLIACALRIFGLPKVQAGLERRRKRADLREGIGARQDFGNVSTVVRMAGAAARYGLVRGNCLSHSLLLWHLLRQEGHEARMRLGGRREGKAFEAHAWVEIDGQVVNGHDDPRDLFTPFEVDVNHELTPQK